MSDPTNELHIIGKIELLRSGCRSCLLLYCKFFLICDLDGVVLRNFVRIFNVVKNRLDGPIVKNNR
jgi:hypothetical protein